MATTYAVQVQNFSLSGSGASIGDTVLNLKSFKDILGVNLTMANFGTVGYGTLEPGNGTQEEQISFSGVTQNSDGTAQLTGVKHVLFISPFTETSGMTVTHPGSIVFVISNTSAYENNLLTVLNNAVASGGVTATSTQIGITKLSVNPAVIGTPIAVGDNDTRIPTVNASSITAGQLAALFGTVATASTSNKYVTNNDTSSTPASGAVVRASASTGLISASYLPVGVASGQIIQANATGLPVIDGSNLTNVPTSTSTNGVITRDLTASGAAVTTAHGLGRTPKRVRIMGFTDSTEAASCMSLGTYNGSTMACTYLKNANSSQNTTLGATSTGFVINLVPNTVSGNDGQSATIAVDATNITLTWTKSGSPTGNGQIMWETE